MSKKVVADMDSDDEIIYSMKQNGYKDRDIRERLINEGRTRYHPKTISTRWARLKRCVEAHADELLDEELSDWHVGEVRSISVVDFSHD